MLTGLPQPYISSRLNLVVFAPVAVISIHFCFTPWPKLFWCVLLVEFGQFNCLLLPHPSHLHRFGAAACGGASPVRRALGFTLPIRVSGLAQSAARIRS